MTNPLLQSADSSHYAARLWGAPFYMDSIYTTQEGYKIKFTELKCYFTLFGNGSNALHQAALLDYRETGSLLFEKEGDYAKFNNLSAILGVDSSLNHLLTQCLSNRKSAQYKQCRPNALGLEPRLYLYECRRKVDTVVDGTTYPDLAILNEPKQ